MAVRPTCDQIGKKRKGKGRKEGFFLEKLVLDQSEIPSAREEVLLFSNNNDEAAVYSILFLLGEETMLSLSHLTCSTLCHTNTYISW